MWWTFWKEIWVEGLCLVNTLLSCEVCDEQFEKKFCLKGCVWSLHCCLVKYVMNSLKRNLGWKVVFGHYIVVLWSMWWTFWKEILFEGLCLVNTLLSCEVCDKQFEKKSGLMNHIIIIDKDWKKSSQEKYWKAFKYFFLTLWKVLKLIFPLIEKHRIFFS